MKGPFNSRFGTSLLGRALLILLPCVGIAAAAQLPEAEELTEEPLSSAEDTAESDWQQRLIEILALAGWDESRLSKFADGEPISIDEQLEIYRFVERLTTLNPTWMDRRHGLDTVPDKIRDAPGAYRGRLIRLKGRARRFEVERPSPEDRGEFSLDEFYRTTIDVDGMVVEVTTPTVPVRWDKLEQPLDQPVELAGVFVKLAADPGGGAVPQFVATEIGWFPTKVIPPTVNYGMSVLGILGVDVGQLDRLVQRRPLTPEDAPAFYQVLEGMGSSQVSQLQGAADRQLRAMAPAWEERLASAKAAKDRQREILAKTVIEAAKEGNYSVAPFFNTPREQVGQIASFTGTVRSALRVEVEPQVASRHAGLDHYFQLAIFTADSQNYPIFFCVRELPAGFPLGDDLDVPVEVAGFFLKMWQYRSRMEESTSDESGVVDESVKTLQAPLFVGVAPQVIPAPASDRTWGYVAAVGVLTILAGVWLIEWVRARRDRTYAATTLARVQQSARELDFDRLGAEEPLSFQINSNHAEHPATDRE